MIILVYSSIWIANILLRIFTSMYSRDRVLWWFICKESACNPEDLGLTPRSGRSPRERNGYPLQYSWLENSMDRGAWVGYSPLGHKSVRHDLATQQQEQIVDTCEQWETPLKPQQSLLKWPHWSSSEPPCVNLHLSICWPCETHLRVCTASGSS